MATPSTRAPPNPSAAIPGTASSRARDLSGMRNGEAGSAFRGITKGRGGHSDRGGGRVGHRSGRGGRGANGASRGRGGTSTEPSTPKTESVPLKLEVPGETKLASTTTGATSPLEDKALPATASNEKPPKPKMSSRRGSRNVPAVVVAPSSPSVQTAPSSPSRPKNGRKRSHQDKGPTNPTRQNLSIDPIVSQSALRPQKARTGPPTPTIVKDIPPHLSAAPEISTFDMKHDIDVLVERMRSAAMSDNLRPSTPGSHIDWAGDDDDSLPDLNDWGVTTSVSKDAVEMSPIMVDTLKPLPEAVTRIKVEAAAKEAIAAPLTSQGNAKLNASKAASSSTPSAVSSQPTKIALHPSLPAKPATSSLKSSERSKAKPVPTPAHASRLTAEPAALLEKTSARAEPPVSTVENVSSVGASPVAAVVKLPSSVVPEPLIAVTVAEPVADVEEFAVEKKVTENNGLSASMHAPSPLSESASLPSLSSTNLSTAATPAGSRSFNPTHQRAHTVGRTPNPNPTSPQAHQRFPRSGGTARGGYHGRTHSSPPAGSGLAPRAHAQRPVLTVDALSRIAKTLGTAPPARAKEVPAATD